VECGLFLENPCPVGNRNYRQCLGYRRPIGPTESGILSPLSQEDLYKGLNRKSTAAHGNGVHGFLCHHEPDRKHLDLPRDQRTAIAGPRLGLARGETQWTDPNGAYLRDILIFKKPMAITEAHGKHGIFTDNFCVFRGFRGYLPRFRLESSVFQNRPEWYSLRGISSNPG